MQDTGLGRLSLDPDTTEQRCYQSQIAAMYAFQDLMEILQTLDNPNAWEFRLWAFDPPTAEHLVSLENGCPQEFLVALHSESSVSFVVAVPLG